MPVPLLASASVVAVGAGRGGERGEGPQEARGHEAVVLDEAASDEVFLARRASDGCGAGVCLEPPGVGEAGAVVANLGEHPGRELDSEPGEGQEYLSVREPVAQTRRTAPLRCGGLEE